MKQEKLIVFRHWGYNYFSSKISEKVVRNKIVNDLFDKGYVPLNVTIEKVKKGIKKIKYHYGYAGKKQARKIGIQKIDEPKIINIPISPEQGK